MTPQQKRVIRHTWQRVGAIGDVAAGLFYERLFEINPELRTLFVATDMRAQRAKLLQALGMVVASLDRLDALVPVLETLGRRHVDYGVLEEHYRQVGAALLWTLECGLGDDWTAEAEDAWTDAYACVCGIMMGAAEQRAPVGAAI